MSNYIDDLSLLYLVSDQQKEKLEENKVYEKKEKSLDKDKKFYKNRIISSIKDILYKRENSLPNDVHKQINGVFKSLILHYKEIDKMEIIQTEYENLLETELDKILEERELETDPENIRKFDKLCMKKGKSVTMDNFVTIHKLNKKEEVYPKKKKYKIKSAEFRDKGIKKKKNVNINYGDKDKKET